MLVSDTVGKEFVEEDLVKRNVMEAIVKRKRKLLTKAQIPL